MATRVLAAREGQRILVIDADPAVGLCTALGVSVRKSVNDIRNEIIESIKVGTGGDKQELISAIDYEFLDAMQERKNLAFLAVGRPEDEGCYCQLNTLLKSVMQDLADRFDYVLIDAEAGIEQVNRRVMEMVTHMVLVTDTTVKGCNVASAIAEVAKKTVSYEKIGVVINRVRNAAELENLGKIIKLPVVGWLPEDDAIRDFDLQGRSFFELPDCGALGSMKQIVEEFV